MQLQDKLEKVFRLDEFQKKALKSYGLFTVSDLLFYFPTRYSQFSEIKKISELKEGETATIYGKISKLKTKKTFQNKIPIGEGEIEDLTSKIKIIWWNQAYLAKMIKDGESVRLTGKVAQNKGDVYLSNPEVEKIPYLPIDSHQSLFGQGEEKTGLCYPIYHETKGLTSKWIYHAIDKIIKNKTIENIEDYLPKEILEKYNLPKLSTALFWIHKPKNEKDALSARKRFAFEEVFFIQIKRQKDKKDYEQNKSFQIKIQRKQIESFLKSFKFTPTKSQISCIDTILKDLEKNKPMARLLEGDVGSGKTLVAATASYATISNTPEKQNFGNLQVAYMAPTEILATQHFESFIKYFDQNLGIPPINIGLITGKTCRKFPSKISHNQKNWTDISKNQLLKWVANGEIPILIGTHSLIQKSVKFKHLALAIIDEQHRFGSKQRKSLVSKEGFAPHLLSMTATPIPRTLALTIYGDLDLSLLDEMPQGRKKIITEIVTDNKREETYKKINIELEKGKQLYVICPRIDEPDKEKEMALNVKSAINEAKRLKKDIFPEYEIGVLHSKLNKQKKEEVMKNFSDGKIDILCATSVVEVGVNVPNATIIIIEGAERFGLAQLHQLRGRVARSNDQAYCFVFANAKTEKTLNRLNALKDAKNGFDLAELDLSLRGAGELGGTKQWGITDLGMEAMKNIKMVEAARTEAINIIEKDLKTEEYSLLHQKVKEKTENFHFE